MWSHWWNLLCYVIEEHTNNCFTNEEAASNAAFDILNNMDQTVLGGDLYNFAGKEFLANKNNRGFFLKALNNQIRYEQIMYAFKAAGKKVSGP